METNQQPPATQTTIGFLGYREFDDGKAYRGAILVTDESSKPLEFRCTAPVRPTNLQRTLYGKSLLPHILTELIAVPLIASMREKPQLILITDDAFFDVRQKIAAPVVRVARPSGSKSPRKTSEIPNRFFFSLRQESLRKSRLKVTGSSPPTWNPLVSGCVTCLSVGI